MQNLASCTMAVLRIKGLFTTQLILDSSAVTAAFVQSLEIAIVFLGVDFVRSTEFPFVFLAFDFMGFRGLLCCVFIFFRGRHFGE